MTGNTKCRSSLSGIFIVFAFFAVVNSKCNGEENNQEDKKLRMADMDFVHIDSEELNDFMYGAQ